MRDTESKEADKLEETEALDTDDEAYVEYRKART